MYIYLHIDVAMCLFAIVEILKVTLIIIEEIKNNPNQIGMGWGN